MPVEIRELIIRAVVGGRPAEGEDQDEEAPGRLRLGPARDDGDRDAIVEECVRQVLRILQQKKAR
jgi:hypothetical protein